MKHALTIAAALLMAAQLTAKANYLSDIDNHEKCIKAVDYKGCIEVFSEAIKGQIKPDTQNIKLTIDTQVAADGNQCPSEFAYAGAGYCRRVICTAGGLFGSGHHPDLAGKGIACHKGRGQMRWGSWDKEKVRASINPECPHIPLKVGYQSTCEMIVRHPGDSDDTINEYLDIANRNPTDWRKNNNLGATLIGKGRYEEAMIYLKRANQYCRDSDPSKWITEFNLALAGEALNPGNPASKNLIIKAMGRRHKLFDRDWQATVVGDKAVMHRLLNYPEVRDAR